LAVARFQRKTKIRMPKALSRTNASKGAATDQLQSYILASLCRYEHENHRERREGKIRHVVTHGPGIFSAGGAPQVSRAPLALFAFHVVVALASYLVVRSDRAEDAVAAVRADVPIIPGTLLAQFLRDGFELVLAEVEVEPGKAEQRDGKGPLEGVSAEIEEGFFRRGDLERRVWGMVPVRRLEDKSR